MQFITKRRLGQSGDTIMEVMVCVAIVGFLMTAAFALSNRNTTYSRASQERSEAVGLAETQLEKLRNYADTLPLPKTPTDQVFCIGDPLAGDPIIGFGAQKPSEDASADNFDYPPECEINNGASDYRFAIWSPGTNSKAAGATATSGRYMVTVRWEAATGHGRDQIEMFYQIHDRIDVPFGAISSNPFPPNGGNPPPIPGLPPTNPSNACRNGTLIFTGSYGGYPVEGYLQGGSYYFYYDNRCYKVSQAQFIVITNLLASD